MDRKCILYDFVLEAKKREFQGLSAYGQFDPEKDTRILSVEAQEECVDILNYTRFLLRKYPQLRSRTQGVKRLTFALYYELRKLEKAEMELTSEKGGSP